MTHEETLTILAILKAAYPSFYKDMTKKDAEGVVSLWEDMFAGDDGAAVGMAVKSLIASDSSGYPPNIGKVKEQIAKLTQPQGITEMEAWNLVSRALRNSIYNFEKEFAKLPPDIQQTLGSHNVLREWAMLDTDEVQTVIQSNFMRSYKAKTQSNKEFSKLPAEIKRFISGVADRLALGEGE